ncbi:MAG TPA: hypothetical protein VKZ18_17935 [Polyangia bacterium]|nr:hypothetical protein [Polyangia bacterium]
MNAQEHPEDLIDRARRGGLPPDAQAALDRHLRDCSVCAGQVALAARFERELAPQPRDHLMYQRAVEGALARLQQSPLGRRRAAQPRWARWAAAALLLIAGVTAAAAVGRRVALRSAVQPSVPVAVPVTVAPTAPPRPPVEAPPPEAPQAETPVRAPAAHGAHRPSAPTITAGELFEKGVKLQTEGHAEAAIATYRRLQGTFPQTPEAGLSFALGGELLLKVGRPGDALAMFDRHLKVDGEVGEEALAGRADALEQLHRTTEAVAAWKTLLARYPRSVYAERARARLEQLTGHP